MPVIVTPPQYRFPWYARLFFWDQRRRYGAVAGAHIAKPPASRR